MSARYVRVPRPTETAAIRAVSRSGRVLPPIEALFAGLLTARSLQDLHGMQLFGLAIVRAADSPTRS